MMPLNRYSMKTKPNDTDYGVKTTWNRRYLLSDALTDSDIRPNRAHYIHKWGYLLPNSRHVICM